MMLVMPRISHHVEPQGPLQIARHYVRELIYGANDGIITTFAVVAGVAGGGLSLRVVLIIGAANLFADGLSMAVGNYLSIRSHESVLEAQALPEEEASPLRHGGATFLAFVLAGAVPLLPYMIPLPSIDRFTASIALTLLALFAVGASRAVIANVRWWTAGLEMLSLGAVVAALAYGSGAVVAALVGLS
jgi:VIT1/CCC1 family predicted Fe2+/Mn2+ transporter